MLPPLLSSLLLKDYNIHLIRACCDKIINNQLLYEGFIPILIALAKDSTIHCSIYALRALTLLSRHFPIVVYEYGGLSIGMWHICISKNEDLLDAALDMVCELVTVQNIHLFGQAIFISKLIDILRIRVGQYQLRYRSTLLQKTCSLILKFSQVPSLLSLCLNTHVHQELIDILARGAGISAIGAPAGGTGGAAAAVDANTLLMYQEQYQPILLHVTACMGQMYVNANSQIMGAPATTALHDATVLVRSLAVFTTRDQLRLCLNLLIILQYLLRLPKTYYARLTNTKYNKITGAIQFTIPDYAFEQRLKILQTLTEEENLDGILEALVQCCIGEEERTTQALELSGAIQTIDGRPTVVADAGALGEKEDWLLGRRLVAKNVKDKSKWFRTRLSLSKNADWNVKTIWQKDTNKQFLTIPKA